MMRHYWYQEYAGPLEAGRSPHVCSYVFCRFDSRTISRKER